MCRLLLVKSENVFDIETHLKNFAAISKNSKEYQGHGWGCSYLDEKNEWKHYKNINPVWKDDLSQFGKTKMLVAHARSAFKDEGIFIENNMPFHDPKYVFIFNGELQGVRIKEEGRIGAEKIFNFFKRFDNGDTIQAFVKGVSLIKKKSRHIRGMNIIVATKENVYLNTTFEEDKEYYTMHYKETGHDLLVCSDPYPGENDWSNVPNNAILVW